jgi:small-conductance mechanosensitive channel
MGCSQATDDRGTRSRGRQARSRARGLFMNNIIYIVGLIVVVLAILSFLGLR